MRRVGDLMQELGFRKDAPESVQKAFVKNLVRAAYGADVAEMSDYRPPAPDKTTDQTTSQRAAAVNEGPAQLSFFFGKE